MKAQKLIEKLRAEKVQDILDNAHEDAVYYVDEWTDNFGGVHGYCTDKMIVGIHNPHTHCKLSELREAMETLSFLRWVCF